MPQAKKNADRKGQRDVFLGVFQKTGLVLRDFHSAVNMGRMMMDFCRIHAAYIR